MRKPNLKPRVPDIAGNKKYDDYSPKSVGDAGDVDRKLSGKSKALLVVALVVSCGIGYSAVQMASGDSGGGVVMPPSAAPVATSAAEGPEEVVADDGALRYDSNLSSKREAFTVGGLEGFYGQYDKANYEKSLKYSKDLEKKYGQNFKFYPIVGQDTEGIDILSDGRGYGFRASGNGDTLYGLLYGSADNTQKWLDEYSASMPQITGIYRSLPTRLMSGKFKYDDISVTQRIATPDILITVSSDKDYSKEIAGFSKYLAGSDGFEGTFKITVQVAGFDVLGKHMNDKGVSSLTYENFYTNVSSADIGPNYEFQIKSKS